MQEENIVGIANKTGYAHKRRLRGILKAAERELQAMTGESF